MFSYSTNSTWASNTYTQEVGDANWSQYQVQITGGAIPLTVKSANTTSTSLALRTVGVINSGDGLVLSTDGTTFKSGVAGAITVGSASTTFTNVPATTVAQSTNLPAPATIVGMAMKVSPDGKLLWRSNGTNIIEYMMTTPNDLTTATATGKSISGNSGFDISFDGRYLFYVYSSANLGRKTLTTPWDISSGSVINQSGSGVLTGTYFSPTASRTLRISRDGTKLFIFRNGTSGTGVLYVVTLTRAFDATSLGVVTTGPTISATAGSFDISDDGKKWTFFDYGTLVDAGAPNISTGKILQYTASTAWDISTLTLTSTFTTGNVLYNTQNAVGGFVSNDGTTTAIMMNSSYATYTSDVNIHQTIDISSFSLGSAPTLAYTKVPNVSVTTSATANRVSLFNTSLYLESATTSSVTLGYSQSNAIAAGDTLLLNGSNLITTSAVVETANGTTTASLLSSAVYNSVTLATGMNVDATHSMRFSPDGLRLFLSGYSTSYGWAVYKFTLTVPWDVSTGTLVNPATDIYKSTVSSTSSITVDFKPDGKKMFLAIAPTNYVFNVYEYSLAVAWDLSTVSATATSSVTASAAYNTLILRSGRFNPTGTQYVVTCDEYVGAQSQSRVAYFSVSTPYTLSTAGAAAYVAASSYLGNGLGVIIPGGTKFLTTGLNGAANAYCYSTLTSSYDMSSFTTTGQVTNTGLPTVISTGVLRTIEFSADGTRMYVMKSDSAAIYQFSMPFVAINKYACTFATQTYTPTSVTLPDRSVNTILTPALVNGNLVSSGNITLTNARAIAFKITNNGPAANVTNATINLWK